MSYRVATDALLIEPKLHLAHDLQFIVEEFDGASSS